MLCSDRRGPPRRIELNRDRRDGDRDRRDGDRDGNDQGHDRRDEETSSRRDSDKRDDRKERPAQPKKIEEQKPPVSECI